MVQILPYIKNDKGYQYRYQGTDIADRYLRLQVDIFKHHGISDYIIATNFNIDVPHIRVDMKADWSAFANKLSITNHLIKKLNIKDDICLRDVDAYMLVNHDFPDCNIGFALHSLPPRTKYQLGIQYWSKNSFDIVDRLSSDIIKNRVKKEESYFNGWMKKNNIIPTILGYEFNFFRAGEMERKYPLTKMPIINLHMKFEYESVTTKFIDGNNKLGVKVCPEWLTELAIKHGLYKEVK